MLISIWSWRIFIVVLFSELCHRQLIIADRNITSLYEFRDVYTTKCMCNSLQCDSWEIIGLCIVIMDSLSHHLWPQPSIIILLCSHFCSLTFIFYISPSTLLQPIHGKHSRLHELGEIRALNVQKCVEFICSLMSLLPNYSPTAAENWPAKKGASRS